MPDSPLETNQGYAKRECSASRTGGSIARTEPGVRGVCALEILHELLIKRGLGILLAAPSRSHRQAPAKPNLVYLLHLDKLPVEP